jgi:MFS family permease
MSLLSRLRDFRLVWIGGLISTTGDWMLFTALPVYVYVLTDSTLATGAMLAARVIPRLVLGSVAGVFVDRWERRRMLIVANVLLTFGLLPLLLVTSREWLWLVYVVALAQAALAQFVTPALGALLPRLVEEHDLLRANSLNALSTDVSRLVGPALGGLVVASTGLAGVALLDSLSFAAAAIMIALTSADGRPLVAASPPSSRPPTSNPWAPVVHQWLDGLRQVPRNRVLTVMFCYLAISGIGEGVMGTLFAPFATHVLGGDALAYGWLVSAQAIGGISGSLLLTWRGQIATPPRLVGFGALGLCTFDLMTFNYHVIWPGVLPGIVFMAIVGIPIAGMVAGATTLMQLATEDAYRGRILGAYGAVGALSMLVGATLGGVLGDRIGIVAMLNMQSLGYGSAAVIVLIALWNVSERSAVSHQRSGEDEALIPDQTLTPTHSQREREPASSPLTADR